MARVGAGAVVIRAEAPRDGPGVAAVVAAAFGRTAEARLVDDLRRSGDLLADLCLVAVAGRRVVGHVAVSRAELRGPRARVGVALLGPMAVEPGAAGRGTGSALVRAAVGRAETAGEPMVVLEGDPAFYGRLGFEPASPLGVSLPLPAWAPPEAAQLVRLGRWRPSLTGMVAYPAPFAGVEGLPSPRQGRSGP